MAAFALMGFKIWSLKKSTDKLKNIEIKNSELEAKSEAEALPDNVLDQRIHDMLSDKSGGNKD